VCIYDHDAADHEMEADTITEVSACDLPRIRQEAKEFHILTLKFCLLLRCFILIFIEESIRRVEILLNPTHQLLPGWPHGGYPDGTHPRAAGCVGLNDTCRRDSEARIHDGNLCDGNILAMLIPHESSHPEGLAFRCTIQIGEGGHGRGRDCGDR